MEYVLNSGDGIVQMALEDLSDDDLAKASRASRPIRLDGFCGIRRESKMPSFQT